MILLNEIDAALTKLGISTKIVFLAYFELLDPPAEERLLNEGRFIFMFAPVARNYYSSWKDALKKLPEEEKDYFEFPLNRFCCVTSNESQLVYLKKWKEVFKGDSFIFDYYLCADLFRDFGTMRLSKTIFEDVSAYRSIGVNGLTSCQIQRAFFPCGFPMYVLGKALSTGESYEEIKEEYFSAAFGGEWKGIVKILERLSRLTPHKYVRFETNEINLNAKKDLEILIEEIPLMRKELALYEGATPF